MGHEINLNKHAATTAPAGPRTVKLDAPLEIREGWDKDKFPAVAKWTEHLSTTWNLVPADTQTIEIIDDPSLAAAIQKSIRIDTLEYTARDPGRISFQVTFDNTLPVPVAFDVFIRAGEKEHKITSIYVQSGNNGWGTSGDFQTDAPTADLIFRSNRDVANNSVSMTKMWKGEVTLKNVPIKRPPSASQPATKK